MAGILIAISGKGGSGKTTLAAMMIRELIRIGKKPVLAVDADPNATLGMTLGASYPCTIADLRDDMMEVAKKPSEIPKDRLMDQWLAELFSEQVGFDLLTMGRPEGPHCYCYVNGLLRRYLKLLRDNYPCVVVDCEAGMEHLSRLTVDDVNTLVLVAEPTGVGLATAKRIAQLSEKLPIRVGQRILVVNKTRESATNLDLAEQFADLPALRLGVQVPFDEDLADRSYRGEPIDESAGAAARKLSPNSHVNVWPLPAGHATVMPKESLYERTEDCGKMDECRQLVTIGATADEGGTRTSTVTLGGATALPFLSYEGDLGHRPAVAVEVWDGDTQDWPEQLANVYGDLLNSPARWAQKAVELGADLICLRLMAAHPDAENRSPEQCVATVQEVLSAVGVPLIIWGCGRGREGQPDSAGSFRGGPR